MIDKKSIGQLIKEEVQKQNIPITDFADMINCTRQNVYDVFRRTTITIEQLKTISQKLHHNFFKEIAEDISLINSNDYTDLEIAKSKAVSQFFEMVPNILSDLGKSTSIIFTNNEALPDFAIKPYFITLTILESLTTRMKDNCFLEISELKSRHGAVVELCRNKVTNFCSLNIKLDCKTKEEWTETLNFAFEVYEKIEHQ